MCFRTYTPRLFVVHHVTGAYSDSLHRLPRSVRVEKTEIISSHDSSTQVEHLCHPCTRLFANKKLNALNGTKYHPAEYDEMDRLNKAFPSVCAKNPAGERCGVLAVKNQTTGSSFLDQISKAARH